MHAMGSSGDQQLKLLCLAYRSPPAGWSLAWGLGTPDYVDKQWNLYLILFTSVKHLASVLECNEYYYYSERSPCIPNFNNC